METRARGRFQQISRACDVRVVKILRTARPKPVIGGDVKRNVTALDSVGK
jgi:hypothetical protein